jgi:hypothetical protein
MESPDQKTDKMATLLGGTTVTVRKLDGTTEEVKILQLPISKFPEMIGAMDDEIAMVELFCGKPKGWAETLQIDDVERVVIEGERVNKGFFERWFRRKVTRAELMYPGSVEKIMTTALNSRTSSPNSP